MFGSPPLPPLPKISPHSPPALLPTPGSIGIVPSNIPVIGSNALISLALKLKLPTRRSPPNSPKLSGARASPPRCSELAAGDQSLQEDPIFVEDIDNPHPLRQLVNHNQLLKAIYGFVPFSMPYRGRDLRRTGSNEHSLEDFRHRRPRKRRHKPRDDESVDQSGSLEGGDQPLAQRASSVGSRLVNDLAISSARFRGPASLI